MRTYIRKRMGNIPVRWKLARVRECNLCESRFKDVTGFERFCTKCREESEVFRFGDWMPILEKSDQLKISA